jgi:multimeric flavodoxin WrbA
MSKLKALFLIGSLKQNSEDTNTLLLSQFLAKQFSTYDTDYEIVRLADHDIKPGTFTNVGSDDWPASLEKILDSDIVIFATPVWGNSIFTYSESN